MDQIRKFVFESLKSIKLIIECSKSVKFNETICCEHIESLQQKKKKKLPLNKSIDHKIK